MLQRLRLAIVFIERLENWSSALIAWTHGKLFVRATLLGLKARGMLSAVQHSTDTQTSPLAHNAFPTVLDSMFALLLQ